MLITQLKNKNEILNLLNDKILLISCLGCKELYFPLQQVNEFKEELKKSKNIIDDVVTDYLCNPEYFIQKFEKHKDKIESSDAILIFSCGVGVQTLATEYLNHKKIYAGCDTMFVPGFQGITALEYNCEQCGECLLSYTGAICPLTSCAKSLINGPCGGAKNGKCEVDKNMDCGWEKIYKKLENFKETNKVKDIIKLRDFSKT